MPGLRAGQFFLWLVFGSRPAIIHARRSVALALAMIDSADHVTHALPVAVATRLHFSDGKSRAIFTVDLVQDLLGDWVLTQAWDGAEGRSAVRRVVVEGHEQGLQMLQKIARHKERLGFRQVHLYHVG